MQRYLCNYCDLECETSECPICHRRTYSTKTVIYWCTNCHTATFSAICENCGNNCNEIAADLRPVFPEERLLIEVLLHRPFCFSNQPIFTSGGGVYFVDGEKFKLNLLEAAKNDPKLIINELEEFHYKNKEYCDNFFNFQWVRNYIQCNKSHLSLIETESANFIRQEAGGVQCDSMFMSFSGGKDSTVVSNLVMEALGTEKIIHIFGDTTLEYPSTEEYIQMFRKEHPRTPLIVAKNKDQSFSNLCDLIGPPSRVLRWCCTVFKTGAINRKLEVLFENKKSILAFQGIRRAESTSRDKYERVSTGAKITKQKVCQPIIDWLNFDVWLYIFSKGITFNQAYRQGFSRVGCWCCPNNSDWASFLSSIYMNEQFVNFQGRLYSFAKSIGKKDWKAYIDDGNWKARQGGNNMDYSKNAIVEYQPCVNEANAFNFELTRPLSSEFYSLFIPFGIIDKTIGNPRLGEVFILGRKTRNPIIKITGKEGQNKIKITILDPKHFVVPSKAKNYIKAQVVKFQTCIGCSACSSICKQGAISIENNQPGDVSPETIEYRIDPIKCIGCLECVLHFDNGCYIKKVLRKRLDNVE